ncbi:DUF6545 domain-containing protein [Kitasatospora albolonga]|uniref:DUF6545 domain-containing protein n=1 Tax=Kitasatospora albolonga TaxID=68173 RepID=UPI003CD0A0EC
MAARARRCGRRELRRIDPPLSALYAVRPEIAPGAAPHLSLAAARREPGVHPHRIGVIEIRRRDTRWLPALRRTCTPGVPGWASACSPRRPLDPRRTEADVEAAVLAAATRGGGRPAAATVPGHRRPHPARPPRPTFARELPTRPSSQRPSPTPRCVALRYGRMRTELAG